MRLGWVDLCVTPCCASANSALFSTAQAESGRLWNNLNKALKLLCHPEEDVCFNCDNGLFPELFDEDGAGARLAFTSADGRFEIYVVEGALGIDIDDIREADLRNRNEL